MFKKVYLKYLLAGVTIAQYSQSIPFYYTRSQSQDSARQLVGLEREIHLYRPDACDLYKVMDITFSYTRTFDSKEVAQSLFGTCLTDLNCPTIKLSGTAVANRGERDWDASFFFLPNDYESSINFKPRIENYVVDFNFYFGFDQWCAKGMYLIIHAPVVYSKWNLNYCETIFNQGTQTNGLFPDLLALQNFTQYINEERAPDARAASIVLSPLASSRWATQCDRLKETRLSDIQIAFGWDFIQCENRYLGLSLRGAIPTGNRPHCNYLFEPIVGNGHHWEFGIGLDAYHSLWNACDSHKEVGFYLEAQITHLFKDRQCRTFDLKQGCNTRYLPALMLPPNSGPTRITSVANLTNLPVHVSIQYQADVTAMISYRGCCYTFDIGYNFWARGCEKICVDTDCRLPFSDDRVWRTLQNATIFSSVPAPQDTVLVPITLDLIDVAGAETKAMSNKVFGNISRTWEDNRCGKSYFAGIGGFAEFGKNTNTRFTLATNTIDTTANDCTPCKNSCLQVTPSQWGLWFKVGVSYN